MVWWWFGVRTSQEVKVGAESAGRSRVVKGDALGPWWEVFWKAHLPGEAHATQQGDEPGAGLYALDFGVRIVHGLLFYSFRK